MHRHFDDRYKKSLLTFCNCSICMSTGHIRKGRWSAGNAPPSTVFGPGLTQTWTTACTAWFCCWALAAAVAAKEAAIALASASGCAGGKGLRNAAIGPVDWRPAFAQVSIQAGIAEHCTLAITWMSACVTWLSVDMMLVTCCTCVKTLRCQSMLDN